MGTYIKIEYYAISKLSNEDCIYNVNCEVIFLYSFDKASFTPIKLCHVKKFTKF